MILNISAWYVSAPDEKHQNRGNRMPTDAKWLNAGKRNYNKYVASIIDLQGETHIFTDLSRTDLNELRSVFLSELVQKNVNIPGSENWFKWTYMSHGQETTVVYNADFYPDTDWPAR